MNNFPPATIDKNFNTTPIDLEPLLNSFLRHAKDYATSPEEILDIVALCIGLNTLVDTQNWYKLSANQCHTLIAACDKIIYQKDWQEEIDTTLITEEGVNYPLCDFVYELDIDIWQQLFSYFCEHPTEIQLLPYLLAFTGDDRSKQVLDVVERNIYQYLIDQNALLVPLRYLRNHPGEGIGIIIAALTSLYDWPRGIACMILDEWGHEHLTPALRHALHTAQSLSNHPVVNARIEALLTGKKFQIEDALE